MFESREIKRTMITIQKSLKSIWIIAGIMLGMASFGGLAHAQSDEDAQVAGNDDRRSEPAVVKRNAPVEERKEGASSPEGGEATQGVENGVIFGESLDFEQNFGQDFSVKTTPKNLKMAMDFRDAELSDVVKLMSAQTGRNFIIADSLKAGKKITIISPNPVTQAEAYQAFLSALQMNGLTVVQSGRFYKIVELSAGAKEPLSPNYGSSVPANDALVTQVVQLEYVDVSQLKPVLDQLKTANGLIIDYAASNTLIITDTGNSVNRMLSLIKRMDNGSNDGEKLWVYQVQYASVTDMEKLLSQVFQTSKSTTRQNRNNNAADAGGSDELKVSQIVADERTNKLIIVANERSYEKMKRLILKLDVEIPDLGKINVVHLQNSEAQEIYTALNSLVNDVSSGSSRTGSNNNNTQSQKILQSDNISIVANESTNDIIVVASPRDFLAIKNVIKELDKPRRQVYVEAAILEVSLERTRDLGIALHGGNIYETDEGDGYYAGRTELNSLSSLSPASLFLGSGSAPGFLMALAGPTVEIAGLSLPSIGAVLKALQTNTDVNVLQTPTILTLDNQEAEFSVGERIPYITSTGSNYSSLLNSLGGNASDSTSALGSLLGSYGSTSIERVDVALTLKLKPQINEGGTVRLDIEEEIEEVKPGGSDLGGPSTRTRSIKTVVVVPDQQTVVLGGLVKDSESQSVSKVPILGDIPVLGYLFRSTDKTITKQSLLLMLTPYIIESTDDLEKIRRRKQEEHDEFVSFFGRKDLGYVRSVDYDKKHGLLEEIHQAIDLKEAELNAIREAESIIEIMPEDDGIELPDGFSDGYSNSGGSAGSSSGSGSSSGATSRPSMPNRGGGNSGNRPARGNRGGGVGR